MKILVYGAGGHARVIMEAAEAAGHQIIGFWDDKEDTQLFGLPRLPTDQGEGIVIAIGDNQIRRVRAGQQGRPCTTIIHPSAWVSPSARIGKGCVIMAGAVVQSQTQIGDGAIINTGATVDHDCNIGAFAHVAPGCHLCGHVTVRPLSLVPVGTCIKPGRTYG